MKIPQTKRYSVYKKLVLIEEQRRMDEEGEERILFFEPDGREHYVYRVTDHTRSEKEHYYGSHTPKKGKKYNSLEEEFWTYKTSSKYNVLNENKKEQYKIKILKVFDNPADKMIYEAFLHQYFNVKLSTKFWNESNQTPFGYDTTGVSHSEETKKKISAGNKNKIVSEETRLKLSKSSKGRAHTQESKNKISAAHLGKTLTEEHKRNIGKTSKGRQANLGNKHTDEAKKKISIARTLSKGTYKLPIIKCPYCSVEGGNNNMKRWHFDNCKFK